jgi:hypothetical protein
VTVRFLADEDLHAGIVDGLRSREPAIDILDGKTAGMRGEKDTVLLDLAARQDRILITHDRNTMTRFFMEARRLRQVESRDLHGSANEQDWRSYRGASSRMGTSQAEEWRNQIVYLPFR